MRLSLSLLLFGFLLFSPFSAEHIDNEDNFSIESDFFTQKMTSSTGWDFFKANRSPSCFDAGLAEGKVFYREIYDAFQNYIND